MSSVESQAQTQQEVGEAHFDFANGCRILWCFGMLIRVPWEQDRELGESQDRLRLDDRVDTKRETGRSGRRPTRIDSEAAMR